MLSKRVKPKTLLSKLSILTALVFFLSFLGFYFGTSDIIKSGLEINFKRKTKAETELLSSYIQTLLKDYNYSSIYTAVNQTLSEDPDIVGIKIKEFSGYLINITELHGLKKCKNTLFTPCYYVVKSQIKSSIPMEVEVFFSTENLANLISVIEKVLTAIFLLLFTASELVIFLSVKNAEKIINKVVNSIDNWKSGGIEELKDKSLSPEIDKIVSKVIEMYEELLRERKLDYKLLLFTEEILNILPFAKDEEELINRIIPSLKSLFNFKEIKICKQNCGKGKVLTITPKLKLVLTDETLVPETILKTIKNIISSAVNVINEKEEKEELLYGAVKALANAIDATSPWTRGHSERVAEISLEIGKALGLSEDKLEELWLGALFHDIGKLGVPPEILNKPGKLTPEEYEKVKKHPIWGYRILKPVKAFTEIIPIVLYHHERCDGSGYPEGLKCNQIPLLAKIVAVADVIEAMTAERPYKKSYPLEEVLNYLKEESGKLFSPEVVEAALKAADKIEEIIKNGRGGGI